jgi:hypothetical protein
MEFELIDTGIFNDDRYFDVEVENASRSSPARPRESRRAPAGTGKALDKPAGNRIGGSAHRHSAINVRLVSSATRPGFATMAEDQRAFCKCLA